MESSTRTLRHDTRHMRGRDPHEAHRVATPLELLFDLTFVVSFGVAASELGPRGIRVNAVRPGLTEAATTQGYIHLEELTTSFLERVPLGRLGVSDDIAPGVRYLAGPESSWMTGQSFAIDGGNKVRGAPRGPMFTV